MLQINDTEIQTVEQLLLPNGCQFPEDARMIIRCWESKDVAACPGSGKTTVLLSKLKLLADRMPLDNGAGICVLSHTNVAVNEIKAKMSNYAGKLMNYPNFVGTIQSFMDKFVTMPYLKQKFGKSVQPVDNRTYAEHLCRIIYSWKYRQLTGLVKNNYTNGSAQFTDETDHVGALFLRADGALCISNQKVALAGANSPSAQQFRSAQQDMLIEEGLIKYSDVFQYAQEAVRELTTEYTDLFSNRFQYVFIDEYQDCRENQREVLVKLFDPRKCCVFHIGDPDQAIYGSDKDTEQDWQPEGDYLVMEQSNRYGQEIADILRPLRNSQQPITASCGNTGHKPVLFVYDMNTISSVKDQFVLQLEAHGLNDEKGIYKAIGHIRNADAKGIKISSYWDEFDGSRSTVSMFRYWSAIDELCDKMRAGRMDRAEPIIRKLICRVFHYSGITNADTGREHTLVTLKKTLDEKHFDEYRENLIAMAELHEYSRSTVSDAFRKLIKTLFRRSPLTGQDVMSKLPSHFMEDLQANPVQEKERNVYVDPIRGRRIQFDTIHGVKGETHDATLYLETEMSRSSDIVRILPYFGVEKAGTSPLFDYSRKLVYVGMSRPRKLLCLAIQESTYIRSKNAFQGWNIIDLRSKGR